MPKKNESCPPPPTKDPKKGRGPGPADYTIPPFVLFPKHTVTKTRNPAYTMRIKPQLAERERSPGPKYALEKVTCYGKDFEPKYSMGLYLKAGKPPDYPGPATYAPERIPPMITNRPPVFTLKDRTPDKRVLMTPAPNAYELPPVIGPKIVYKPRNPAYTLSGYPYGFVFRATPGPADYNIGSPEIVRTRAPKYTMRKKTMLPGSKLITPAPNAYGPFGGFWGGKTFGIKHSPFTTPIILRCDNM